MVVGQLLITLTVEICIQQLRRVEEIVSLPYYAIRNMYHALSLCVARVCQWQRRLLSAFVNAQKLAAEPSVKPFSVNSTIFALPTFFMVARHFKFHVLIDT